MKAVFRVVVESDNLTKRHVEAMKEDLDKADDYLIGLIRVFDRADVNGSEFVYVSHVEEYPFVENEDNV